MGRLLAGLAVTLLLVGCGGPTGETVSDCSQAVRRDATTYVEAGFTDRAASKFGHADAAECDDTGADAQGVFFPQDPQQVDVWSFDGLDPSTVIGVQQSNETFRVFMAETLSQSQAKALSRSLPSPNHTEGVRVTAAREVWVGRSPLGDVVVASLAAGDSATASCFEARAQTNGGATGSAVRVEVGDVSGYAAVAIRDPETDGRVTFLEQSETWLRDHLPGC